MNSPRNMTDMDNAVETLVTLIESRSIDITYNYPDWVRIAFALAHHFGSVGESYFHRISAFYPSYSYKETTLQYAKCLKNQASHDGSHVTISTLFYIASQHGITLPIQYDPLPPSSPRLWRGDGGEAYSPSISSSHPLEDFEELRKTQSSTLLSASALPTFSQNIKTNLPSIMQRIIEDSPSFEDSDILILGSLTVFSACIPNVFGVYDRREVFANLFLYVTARASAGKGRLSLCRHLAAPLQKSLRDKYTRDLAKFREEQATFVLNRKLSLGVPPVEPPFLTLFVPANSTATVVYKTLSENGGVGLIFETEGDTLANAFNSDLGNYSDGFRKAFHHETISYLRRKDNEFVEILCPKFSAVLTGTRQQVFNLIPNAENGLFSRFIFYSMQTELVWRDMFTSAGASTADEQFKQIGLDFYSFQKKFSKKHVQFTLSQTQQQQFNVFFANAQQEYALDFGDEIVASVRRLGLIHFRIAMILSVLRLMDDSPLASGEGLGVRPSPLASGEGSGVRTSPALSKSRTHAVTYIVCTDTDFLTAKSIVEVLLKHSANIFKALPHHPDGNGYNTLQALKGGRQLAAALRQRFFAALPPSFNRSAYIDVAASLNITTKTAERYISELCASGQLMHPSQGSYQKP